MTQAGVDVPPGWTLWPLERARWPAWVVGVGILGLYGVVFVGALNLAGVGDALNLHGERPWRVDLVWDNLVTALLCAYLPMMTAASLRGTVRDLDGLRAMVLDSDASESVLDQVLVLNRSWRLRMAMVVALAGALGQLGIALALERAWVGTDLIRNCVDPLRIATLVWFMALAVHLDVVVMRSFYRIGRKGLAIPLFDRSALGPFARQGIRGALLWLGVVAIFSLFKLGRTSGGLDWMWLFVLVGFALARVLVPVLGLRLRLRADKTRLLGEIQLTLRTLQGDVTGSDPAAVESTANRLAPVLAYEARVRSVQEWPFKAMALARLAFFAALGIGSWVGGALVERVLAALLD